MELGEKLRILAGAAKYDASCASSGTSRGKSCTSPGSSGSERRTTGGTVYGNTVPIGVCHSWTGDGRCVSLLKVLYSNVCRFDCAYCVNRASADTERASFTPAELVEITREFYRRNYIEGLFLSSGVFSDPDIVMEKITAVAKKLRTEEGFGGYIHLKIIPGSGEERIREAGLWADRLSANIELPTEKSLSRLAPQKSGAMIFGAMNEVCRTSSQAEEDRRHGLASAPAYAPAGQSTQLIVGASGEDDRTIIGLSGALYKKYGLRRVYYSAYTPVAALPPVVPPGCGGPPPEFDGAHGIPGDAPGLFAGMPGEKVAGGEEGANYAGGASPRRLLIREHRLYQADWLMRFYHFRSDEILEPDGESSAAFTEAYLDPALDPKTAWALRHREFFPLEIRRASYEELLRVPGIGAKSGRRIVEARRSRPLGFDGLMRLGVVLKRARYFITLGGTMPEGRPGALLDNPRRLRRILSGGDDGLQLPLFEF